MPGDPLDFLFGLERLGMKFGLENIARLCEALGNPQQQFRSILIAGTNGKGSVTAMTEAALRAAGYRSARYTSPHLVHIEERFAIDGRDVSIEALRAVASDVSTVVQQLVARGGLEALPTFFECTTAIAFELFRRANVEIAVLEVGLGGRLDATNIVMPIATAITSIDFDHQAQLGASLESIAFEKAGIIKAGVPVVCGPLPREAEAVIAETCDARGARLVRATDAVRLDADGEQISIATAQRRLDRIQLALPGDHQRDNARVAVALVDELSGLGFPVSDAALRTGLEQVRWPARLERFSWRGADILLDAAHNPAGARALASYLDGHGWKDVTLVFGAMRDKDVAGMLQPILRSVAHVICTTAPTPRALPATELAPLVTRLAPASTGVEAIDDPAAALDRARGLGRPVVAAGSIFLIGPLRDILR
ncbi:MAG TPA: folylpolyglutamate synthase/dihydrofolate synthase family protein [Vicinamibacterales bacterium]